MLATKKIIAATKMQESATLKAGDVYKRQVGKKYYLPGTVVPEEKQWEVISAYLQEAGFAYCQDVAELLHVGKRKTAGILRRMVRDGRRCV